MDIDSTVFMPPLTESLVLTPRSRSPVELTEETIDRILAAPLYTGPSPQDQAAKPALPAPTASLIIVTYNNLLFTRLCLESVLLNTNGPDYEIIVVDNGSSEKTIHYLTEMGSHHSKIRVLLNPTNKGFAAANNQGVATASGRFLVLLNNDTLVPPDWLVRLLRHLEDDEIGLIGPVTNRIGTMSEIEAPYETYGEFLEFARQRYQAHSNERLDIPMAAMFCLAFRRATWEDLGPLDERFGVGLFEDDDYSMRARQKGYRVVCAEDVFLHHFGGASFGKLKRDNTFADLFQANRLRFEEKWGVEWSPHPRRQPAHYLKLTERLREDVHRILPPNAVLLVISKGDEELLRFTDRTAHHFPQDELGKYAGHYPADSAAAIAHLESLIQKQADYLLIPETAFWWLDHYPEFRDYLDDRYRRIAQNQDYVIFSLGAGEAHTKK